MLNRTNHQGKRNPINYSTFEKIEEQAREESPTKS